jgi:hypothetical protein
MMQPAERISTVPSGEDHQQLAVGHALGGDPQRPQRRPEQQQAADGAIPADQPQQGGELAVTGWGGDTVVLMVLRDCASAAGAANCSAHLPAPGAVQGHDGLPAWKTRQEHLADQQRLARHGEYRAPRPGRLQPGAVTAAGRRCARTRSASSKGLRRMSVRANRKAPRLWLASRRRRSKGPVRERAGKHGARVDHRPPSRRSTTWRTMARSRRPSAAAGARRGAGDSQRCCQRSRENGARC